MRNNWLNSLPRLALALLLALAALPTLAQAAADDVPEMADALRQSGKIYVVVAVIVVILSGLLAYLIRLDRKVGRLEREMGE